MRAPAITLILVLLISPFAQAKTGTTRLTKKKAVPATEKLRKWDTSFSYSAVTDFADNRSPRSYMHAVSGSLTYNFNSRWSFDSTLSGRAETVGGQIPKGSEQTYDETLAPSTSFSLGYGDKFYERHNYSVYLAGEPLWDEASRQEGYKGLVGMGGKVSLSFFNKYYTLTNSLSVFELINSYAYGSNGTANPDYFYTYKLSNVVKIYGGLRASYTFGTKITRYMDDFTGYSYANNLSLSHAWPQLTVALSYDNGGFTDDGVLRLWYLDEYRRLVRLVVGYSF